jgi:hypothetical protein
MGHISKEARIDISVYFSFAKYLNENFEFFDNTDSGDMYRRKNDNGAYSEENIFKEWLAVKDEL